MTAENLNYYKVVFDKIYAKKKKHDCLKCHYIRENWKLTNQKVKYIVSFFFFSSKKKMRNIFIWFIGAIINVDDDTVLIANYKHEHGDGEIGLTRNGTSIFRTKIVVVGNETEGQKKISIK